MFIEVRQAHVWTCKSCGSVEVIEESNNGDAFTEVFLDLIESVTTIPHQVICGRCGITHNVKMED